MSRAETCNKKEALQFEISWIKQEGFKEKVKEIWEQPIIAGEVAGQRKKRLKSNLKGWGDKRKGDNKNIKMELQDAAGNRKM